MENKLNWFAGLFEGEGTTGLFKQRRLGKGENKERWRIASYFMITNNDPILINEIIKIAEEIGVKMYVTQRNHNHPVYAVNYQVICKNMAQIHKLLVTLSPYLRGNKKAVAEMTIKFLEGRNLGGFSQKGDSYNKHPYTEEDWKLAEEVKKINQRGRDRRYMSSETLREALDNIDRLSNKDKVQTSMKVGEWLDL
jgi:hypothetical protein